MNLNCLPKFVEELQLNRCYNKHISQIPSNLKKIICYADYTDYTDYSYKDDFAIYMIQNYE